MGKRVYIYMYLGVGGWGKGWLMYQNKNSVFNNTKQNLLTYMTDTNVRKQVIYSTKEINKIMIHMHAYKIKIIYGQKVFNQKIKHHHDVDDYQC